MHTIYQVCINISLEARTLTELHATALAPGDDEDAILLGVVLDVGADLIRDLVPLLRLHVHALHGEGHQRIHRHHRAVGITVQVLVGLVNCQDRSPALLARRNHFLFPLSTCFGISRIGIDP